MKKTVLFFPSLYPTVTGGMEVYNYHLSNRLLQDDFSDIIMVTSDPSCKNSNKVIKVSNRLFLTRKWGLDILSILVCCLFHPKVKMREWNHLMIPYTSSFDLNAWPILLFQRLFGFSYSVHCHGGGAKPWKHLGLQKRFFDNAAHKAAVSEALRMEYSQRLGYKLEYLPPLIEFYKPLEDIQTIKNRYGVSNFKKVILYVGSMKPLKAPEILLEAYCSIDKNIKKDVCLILAGEGPLRKGLEEKYSSASVKFLGSVSNHKVCELFTLADIYCIPSWFEGTSVSLLEAMSKKCCCVGTDVQGINTMIKHKETGLLFPKNDSKALQKVFNMIIPNDSLTIALGERAFSFYQENFSYADHIFQVLKFLNYK